jgi:hypothetical protein
MYTEYKNKPYDSQGYILPENTKHALIRYAEYRIKPGDFLTAVLCDILTDAVCKADRENLNNILAIVHFMYNHMPSECWGSLEIVKNWLGGEKR